MGVFSKTTDLYTTYMKIMSGNLLSDVYDTKIILITYIAYKANKTGGRNISLYNTWVHFLRSNDHIMSSSRANHFCYCSN